VVNPPQNPMTNRNLISGFGKCCLSNKPNIKPIRKQPITLTVNVAKGKMVGKYLLASRLARYRRTLPTPPPRPTRIRVLIIINH